MMSIRTRLFAILALVTALVWGGAVVWVEVQTRNEVQRVLDRRLMESARMVSSMIQPGSLSPVVNEEGGGRLAAYDQQLACQIWSMQGELIARSRSAPSAMLASGEDGFSERVIDGERWRVYTVHVPEGGYRVMVGDNLAVREHLVGSVVTGLLGPAVLGLLALGVLIWWSVGAGLQPIQQMTQALASRRADDLTPVDVAPGGKDLQPFVSALNDLIARVSEARRRETEFTAAAAHELRTPLAGLRVQAQIAANATDEGVRKHALEQIQTSVDRTARLVTGLLALAREDEAAIEADDRRWVDLRALLANDADARLEVLDQAFRIYVQPDRFETAVANLLANAQAMASSRIRVAVEGQGNDAILVVEDDGPGVSTADLERLGRRFFRTSDAPVGGSGLGLSIVLSTMKAHGGAVRFTPSALGGLRVELHGLPIRPA
ncbi:MAG: sensor histidine kinase N-terminal domain-containing protein [Brevundimonas diminuta]|jgi:two-component system, OmpR family, sensor histidine kinase QseC|uniref:histidine kinase n=2 Tax=Brevundimonas diminuta TaxID=293 RepID=A0A1Z3M1F9_BREDI|nr:ATP-binding protein [Brevundimonas diminuta]ASD28293.1 two-component sensor histidine kinase [Brevundimonas diminuta]MBI2248758.1 sensor histidine kinase N-terminal domain-containing protein [Brevundimonas diminuta]HCQ53350.1 two-component sensor histidine kinase [Brevundimonas diminuta]